MTPDKLVRMANQIAAFFASQRGDAAASVATHLSKFWDPRMREAILAHLDAGGEGLDDAVRVALGRLRSKPEGAETRAPAA